jgi:hypothetical protein
MTSGTQVCDIRREQVKKLKMVIVAQVAGMAIVTAACGHSGSYKTGYDTGVRDPAAVQKIINEGGVTPQSYCQNLLYLARISSNANNVDGSDFVSGCVDGVQHALKEG